MEGNIRHGASRRWASCVAALSLGLWGAAAWAASTGSAATAYEAERIVAIGDVHGAGPALETLLEHLDLVDGSGRWSGGRTHLISLGDLLDRGDASRAAMDLLMALEAEAAAAGGRVHVVLGNHELMNLTGDLRYVAPGEYAAFAEDETAAERDRAFEAFLTTYVDTVRSAAAKTAEQAGNDAQAPVTEPPTADEAAAARERFEDRFPPGFFAHRRAFAPDGVYGAWLLGKPQITVVNDIAFVHGGLAPWLVEPGIPAANQAAAADLGALLRDGPALIESGALPDWEDLLTADPREPLPEPFEALRASRYLGLEGPSWYRGTALCHPLIERSRLEDTLDALGLTRVVMGHTPTSDRRIQQRFGGRALLADTGMLASYYRGRSSALVIEADTLTAVYLDEQRPFGAFGQPPVDLAVRVNDELLQRLEQFDLETLGDDGRASDVVVGGRRYTLVFERGSRREIQRRQAALALDLLLGFGMVPTLVARRHKARDGTLTALPGRAMTEAERFATGTYRPNECLTVRDFDLMYAFDALIGLRARSADSMIYDRVTWLLCLVGHDEAFPGTDAMPAYLKGQTLRLPAGLAEVLGELDSAALDAALGELLTRRQIEAIGQRAQRLLNEWERVE